MAAQTSPAFLATIDADLAGRSGPPADAALERVIARLGCALGTIHLLDRADGSLHLRASKDLPPAVIERVQRIPIGKGMAGLAAERREPVQVCNLQQEQVVVRPGAKETKAEGSIACPMLFGTELMGVLGVAKRVPYDFNAEEIDLLMDVGRHIARALAQNT